MNGLGLCPHPLLPTATNHPNPLTCHKPKGVKDVQEADADGGQGADHTLLSWAPLDVGEEQQEKTADSHHHQVDGDVGLGRTAVQMHGPWRDMVECQNDYYDDDY